MTIASFKIFKQTDDRAATLSFRITHEMDINCSFKRLAGGQCSQDKRRRAKEKKCPYPSVAFMWKKHLSTHIVCRRKWCWVGDQLNFCTGFNFRCTLRHFGNDHLSSSSLLFGHWVVERFPTIPYRATPTGNRARLTAVLTRRFRRLSKTYQSQPEQIFP